MINWTLNFPFNEADYPTLLELEGLRELGYSDTQNIATIGIGFNLRSDPIRALVITQVTGLMSGSQEFAAFDQLLAAAVAPDLTTDLAVQAALNGVLVDYDMNSGFAPLGLTEFRLLPTQSENIFNVSIVDFEATLQNRLTNAGVGDLPDSREKLALLSLEYNNGAALIGPNLRAALASNDRAEAWWNIRYDSNANNDVAQRRYVESHIFGLYDEVDPDANYRPEEIEALKVARTFNKHINNITTYDQANVLQFDGDPNDPNVGPAQSRLDSIEAGIVAAGGPANAFGQIDKIEGSLDPARRKLVETYADFTTLAPQFIPLLIDAGYQGHLIRLTSDAMVANGLLTHLAIDDQLAANLANASIRNVFVAANTQATVNGNPDPNEVAAHTVDRSSAPAANDLIFGSIEENNSIVGIRAGVADTLSGGAGDDFFVGGGGADVIDGGDDEDTISYLSSIEAVDVDLGDANPESGGFADGDILSNFENVLGSAFADFLAGSDEGNVIFGAGGIDIINGRGGQDFLYGGDDNDTLSGDGPLADPSDAGDDLLHGGAGNDIVEYATETGSGDIDVTLSPNSVPGAPIILVYDTYGKTDTLISIETIYGHSNRDTVDLTGLTSVGIRYFGGGGIDEIRGGPVNDVLGNIHDATFDYAELSPVERSALYNSVYRIDPLGPRPELDGGEGNDIYFIDFSVAEYQQGDVRTVNIGDNEDDVGTKIFLRNMDNGQIDTVGGVLASHVKQEAGSLEPVTNQFEEVIGHEYQEGGRNEIEGFFGDSGTWYQVRQDEGDGFFLFAVDDFSGYIQDFKDDGALEFDDFAYVLNLATHFLPYDSLTVGDVEIDLGVTPPPDDSGEEQIGSDGVAFDNSGSSTVVTGTALGDFAFVSGGDTTFDMGAGADIAISGDGSDTLNGGADDDDLDAGGGNDMVVGDAGDDSLAGGDGADVVDGGTGDDFASGGAGDDELYGGLGEDILEGNAGFDIIFGGGGFDVISGGDDDDELYGEDAGDFVFGDAGNDMLDGGLNDDELYGGFGNDTYQFASGFGRDKVYETDEAPNVGGGEGEGGGSQSSGPNTDIDRIVFSDLNLTDLSFDRDGLTDDLIIRENGTMHEIFVVDHFAGESWGVEEIEFANGTIWDRVMIDAIAIGGGDPGPTILGTENNDTIDGTTGDDVIDALAGDDLLRADDGDDFLFGREGDDDLQGEDGDDVIVGGIGDDTLSGGAGADMLDGGAGGDQLSGGSGSDDYSFDAGFGNDIVIDASNAGDTDRIIFGSDIDKADIEVLIDAQNTDNIILRHALSNSSVVVQDYGLSDGSGIEEIEFIDGTVWDRATIDVMAIPPITTAPDTGTAEENFSSLVDVLANDLAQDDGTLTVTSASIVNGLGDVSLIGNLVLYDSGAENYNELQVGQSAEVEISYSVSDAFGNTASDTLTVTVTGRNDAPTVGNDSATTDSATAIVIDPLANDSDVDGGTVSLTTGFDFSGNAVQAFIFDGLGNVTANNDLLTYDPAGAYDNLEIGETALVQMLYFVTDGQGGTNVGLVQVDVEGTASGAQSAVMFGGRFDAPYSLTRDGLTEFDIFGTFGRQGGDERAKESGSIVWKSLEESLTDIEQIIRNVKGEEKLDFSEFLRHNRDAFGDASPAKSEPTTSASASSVISAPPANDEPLLGPIALEFYEAHFASARSDWDGLSMLA